MSDSAQTCVRYKVGGPLRCHRSCQPPLLSGPAAAGVDDVTVFLVLVVVLTVSWR